MPALPKPQPENTIRPKALIKPCKACGKPLWACAVRCPFCQESVK